MQRLLLLLFTSLICLSHGFSQGWTPVGSRSNSLAGTSVCLDDVWAYHNNPAALSSIRSFSAGAYYETRFLTKELQTQAIAAALPLKKGVLSLGAQFSGYEQYRHTRAGLGYSMQLSEFISVGVQGNVQQLKLGGNYGSSTNGTIEAGVLSKISERWTFGMSVMNIGRQKINGLASDRYTTVLRAGAKYAPSKKVNLLMEVEKQVIYQISFKGAIEYMPNEHFFARIGVHSGPTEVAFGTGYKNKGFSIDLGTKYHQTLGWTPNFGLTYQIKEKDAK